MCRRVFSLTSVRGSRKTFCSSLRSAIIHFTPRDSFDKCQAEDVVEGTMDVQRLKNVAILHAAHKFCHFVGESIGYYGNDSHAPECYNFESQRVVAADHFKTRRSVRNDLIDLRQNCRFASLIATMFSEIFGEV